MYIPTIVIICMVCGAMGGTLGYYLRLFVKFGAWRKIGNEI